LTNTDDQTTKQGAFGARIHTLLDDAAAHYRAMLRICPEARRYLQGRGIGGAIAARFGLGYARPAWHGLGDVLQAYDDDTVIASGLVVKKNDQGKGDGRHFDRFRGRVMFPIRDRAGTIAGFGGRILDGMLPKYLNSPEGPTFRKRELLYGLYEAEPAIRVAGLAVVVEGYLDVVALAQSGFDASVGTLGTACTVEQLALMLAVTPNIVFCFDGDAAGRRAAAKALETILPLATADRSFRFMFLPVNHDPDSFVRAHGVEAFRSMLDTAASLSDYLAELVTAGCELQYAEGRSRCSSLARPYWLALPDGAIKDALRDYCAQILQFSAEEVEMFWMAGVTF
jgi:DNA primase